MENLLISWQEFLRGKRRRRDVAEFSAHFMDNVLALHRELADKTYCHGVYNAFRINDPKPRDIHKASVRDRLVHHAIHRILSPYFDQKFIHDSYSCRIGKGTHRAINRLRNFSWEASKNHTRTVWILKCDIRKFFANIDHEILKSVLSRHVAGADILWLLRQVIDSFNTKDMPRVGLPLGNLTSQLFVNIYMNEFDQFVKRELKVGFYLRYADDFAILSHAKVSLIESIPKIQDFLNNNLKLSLHPNKLFIKTFASGVDFLGWIHFPDHRVLRTATKKRMFSRIQKNPTNEAPRSYLGLLKHGNTNRIKKIIQSFL